MSHVLMILIYLMMSATTAFAATTITVDGEEIDVQGKRVVIEDADGSRRQIVIGDDRPTRTVVIEEHTIVEEDAPFLTPRDFEGEVISLDQARGQVVVRYVDTVERRLEADRQNVARLKIGDDVRVYMRPGDDNEAWKLVKIAN